MKRMKMKLFEDQDRLNGACITMEGLFNTLGHDIIGMTTIVPLFLAHIGASLKLIGSVSTIQSICSALIPLLFGWFVAAANSKKKLSILFNGISRSSILLIPLGIVLGLSNSGELVLFFCVIVLFYLLQPMVGLTWTFLLGDCVPAKNRGKLLGRLYMISGIITFASSAIIKAIRSSPSLNETQQYAAIFFLGGTLLASSVVFFIPLKQKSTEGDKNAKRNYALFFKEMIVCYKNPAFRQILITNIFSNMSVSINTFFYVFAQETLCLTSNQISNLIIFQTFGLTIGGFVTGRISDKFGLKRMLMSIEATAPLVPILGLAALRFPGGAYLMSGVAVFIIGIIKSGLIGYSAVVLEVIPGEKTVYSTVAKGFAMLPFSFTSILVGSLIARFTNVPVFILQIALCIVTFVCASKIKLSLYR